MANGIGYEDLLFLAYESCKVHGITVPLFEEFIKRAVSIEVVSEEPENPTPGEQISES
jgi:hypothetical protein